jgi:alanine dehydrogenase
VTLLVSDKTARENFTMRMCVDAVEAAYAAAGRGNLDLLERRFVGVRDGGPLLHSLSAASGELGYLFSLVYVGIPPGQDKRSTTVSRRDKVFTLFDAATGGADAIMAGRYLSWLNTGAMGAVAIKHLSAPEASSLAIIGSGQQARAALLGALEVRPIKDVRIWSRTRARAEQMVAEFPDVPGMRVCDSAQEAVRDADIVVTVTTSKTPVLEGEWLAPGSHVNSLGAHYPDRREVDTATVVGSTVFVDTLATTTAEKGELLLPVAEGRFSWDDVCAELGQVVCGASPWQRGADERTFFASCGTAVEAFGAAVGMAQWARENAPESFSFS